MSKLRLPVVLMLMVLVSAACGVTSGLTNTIGQVSTLANQAESLATTAAQVVPQAALDDPKAYLVNALKAQLLKDAYRGTATMVSSDTTTEYTVEFQPPDRYRMNMPGVVEGIIIGQTMYVKQGESWIEVPLSADALSGFGLLGPEAETVFDGIQNVQVSGMEILDGIPCLVFTFDSTVTFAGVQATSSNRLWLGMADARIYQTIVTGEAAGVSSTTTVRYVYDPGITIETP